MSNAFYTNNYKDAKIEKVTSNDAIPVPSIEEVMQITQEPVEVPETEMVENQGEIKQEMVENQTEHIQPEPDHKVSFRQLREQKEKAERERDELMRFVQANQKQVPEVQHVHEEDDFDMNADDLVEGKHLKKYAQEIKRLKQDLNQYKQQSTAQTTEARIKAQYPDFDKIVTKDTIESLRYAYPELANTLNSSTDLYSTAVSAYTMIKKLGISSPEPDTYLSDRERVVKNASKPKTVSSIAPQKSESPLSNANAFANGLTPELQKQLWKEMQELRKKG